VRSPTLVILVIKLNPLNEKWEIQNDKNKFTEHAGKIMILYSCSWEVGFTVKYENSSWFSSVGLGE
jgi:hypothetical protein